MVDISQQSKFNRFINENFFDTDIITKGMILFENNTVQSHFQLSKSGKKLETTESFLNILEEFVTGESSSKVSLVSYDLTDWCAAYGKPVQLFLALHIATMMPDLTYDLATKDGTDEMNFDTKIRLNEFKHELTYTFHVYEMQVNFGPDGGTEKGKEISLEDVRDAANKGSTTGKTISSIGGFYARGIIWKSIIYSNT